MDEKNQCPSGIIVVAVVARRQLGSRSASRSRHGEQDRPKCEEALGPLEAALLVCAAVLSPLLPPRSNPRQEVTCYRTRRPCIRSCFRPARGQFNGRRPAG